MLESTTYPGTTNEVLRPILELTGLKSGTDIFLAFSPEREDPGNRDFETSTIPKIVAGDEPKAQMLVTAFYRKVVNQVVPVSFDCNGGGGKADGEHFSGSQYRMVNELKLIYDAALAFRAAHSAHVTTGAGEAAWRAARGLPAGAPLAIGYLGVWDTVGALGVPGHMALARRLNRGLGFHDTRLSGLVGAARHAVAIDERRRTFPPTLWDNLDAMNGGAEGAYAQRWFPGDHGSVGGGGAVSALSDEALVWVAEGAGTQGLALDPAAVAAWRAGCDCLGPLASPKPLLRRLLLLYSADRAGPSRLAELAEPALRRWRGDPGYRPRPLRRLAGLIQV